MLKFLLKKLQNDLISKIASEYNINWLVTGNGNYKIDSKEDFNSFSQTGVNSQQVGTQNNHYTISNPRIKIELKEAYKIYIFNMLKNEEIKTILFLAFIPISIFTFIVSVGNESLNLYKVLLIFSSFYIILGICLFIFNYSQIIYASYIATFKRDNYKNYILIDKERIEIIKKKEATIIIYFKNIRKIEIEKNYMIGYNVFIYDKQLKPTLSYNLHYQDKALLIKELFEEYLSNLK